MTNEHKTSVNQDVRSCVFYASARHLGRQHRGISYTFLDELRSETYFHKQKLVNIHIYFSSIPTVTKIRLADELTIISR